MSYDLMLFHVARGGDASLLFDQFMEREEREAGDPGAEAWAEMDRIAHVLEAWRPRLTEFRAPASILLTDEDLELQFDVSDGAVAVTIPYFRERAREMIDSIAGCLDVLGAAAGYLAYDPQLGRTITSADLRAIFEQYRSVDQALPDLKAQAGRSTKKPWWKIW